MSAIHPSSVWLLLILGVWVLATSVLAIALDFCWTSAPPTTLPPDGSGFGALAICACLIVVLGRKIQLCHGRSMPARCGAGHTATVFGPRRVSVPAIIIVVIVLVCIEFVESLVVVQLLCLLRLLRLLLGQLAAKCRCNFILDDLVFTRDWSAVV